MTDLMVSLGRYFRNPHDYPRINQAIGYTAAGAETYMNPSSAFRTLGRGAKNDVARALSKIMKGGRATSAINMVYGKRRSYRINRRRRAPSRKRVVRRGRKSRRKSSGTASLAVLRKALGGQLSY